MPPTMAATARSETNARMRKSVPRHAAPGKSWIATRCARKQHRFWPQAESFGPSRVAEFPFAPRLAMLANASLLSELEPPAVAKGRIPVRGSRHTYPMAQRRSLATQCAAPPCDLERSTPAPLVCRFYERRAKYWHFVASRRDFFGMDGAKAYASADGLRSPQEILSAGHRKGGQL